MQKDEDKAQESRDALEELRLKYIHARNYSGAGATKENNGGNDFLKPLRMKYSHEPTFLQAVEEMKISLTPLFMDAEKGDFYQRAFLLMTEPERVLKFRVDWMDDSGYLRTNMGYRVEFSSALGPYKGGIRFHPSVDEGILKGLAFEQMFKNALTGLRMGGAKGGSDFDPKGKSEGEVRRFCQSFMTELAKYIHPHTDIPAGDIGVGDRELGYLYGQYKRLTGRHGDGVLTGKPLLLGGSNLRPESTGFGVVYMATLAVKKAKDLRSARCAISGSGNVAQYAAKKLIDVGAKVISLSDSNGSLIFDNGMTEHDWDVVVDAKQVKRARLSSITERITGRYIPDHSPWSIRDLKCDYAFPCATENEINSESVTRLMSNGMKGLFEGANLPTTLDGQRILRERNALYIPGKAANAGGVAVSGFEMTQNIQILYWNDEQVDKRLQSTMAYIYNQMEAMVDDCHCTYEQAANRASFLKVSQAMQELGWIW